MATSAEFLCLTMGLTPKKATTSRSPLYGERFSHQWFGCYHPERKFAECPCCNVGPLPVFPVMSCLIKSVLSQVIHMYSHTYNHTYIHTCMHAINCVSQMSKLDFHIKVFYLVSGFTPPIVFPIRCACVSPAC